MNNFSHLLSWPQYTAEITRCSSMLEVDKDGKSLSPAEGFACLHELLLHCRAHQAAIYVAGNGASAAMASHIAADLAKNGCLRAHTFTDAAFLTCLANDISFEQGFAHALELYARSQDVFVALSSSGRSPNMLAAAHSARNKGAYVVTFTAFNANNALRQCGDFNFYVPAHTYGLAESCHAAILHYVIDFFVEAVQKTVKNT